jgi:hypothetical protein
MYKEHPIFEPPEKDAKIWRYMDFAKLVWMLNHRCLFFTNVDKLKIGDPFEGSCQPSELLKSVPELVAKDFAGKMGSCGPPLTVNCWHLNEDESDAMWKLYGGANEGIAIQSTFSRMVQAFEGFPDSVYIGKIQYNKKFKGIDIFKPILTKRTCFKHEEELRAVIWETSKVTERANDGSVLAEVDLRALIENIYAAPSSSGEYREKVREIVKKFGLEIPVLQSELDRQPLY